MADTFNSAGNFNDPTKWASGILPESGEVLVIAANCTLTAHETLTYGAMTINAGVTFDFATYNFQCGAITQNGVLKGGVSSGTGLTCAGVTYGVGSTVDWQTATKINLSGDYVCNAVNIGGDGLGEIYITSNLMWRHVQSSVSGSYKMTIPAGVTLTAYDGVGNNGIVYNNTNEFICNGTIATGANSVAFISCSTTGSITFGANSDITGAGSLAVGASNGGTVTVNKTSGFSFTGTLRNPSTTAVMLAPCLNVPNATYRLRTGGFNRILGAGTLYAANLEFENTANTDMAIINSTNNPSFVITGNINLKYDANAYTLTYTKGTGYIYLSGTSGTATIDLQGKSVEQIVLACSGTAIKSITGNFSTVGMSGNGGTVQSSLAGTARTITVTNSTSVYDVQFKDITINGGTITDYRGKDLGNNTNIIFSAGGATSFIIVSKRLKVRVV